ncbi:NACHT domain-containing protein [Thalassospira lucentensis]|uniref:NACHT domain-containing protein n=1 Tax=Thalassospira lucentensis TaxID=168935 RepID=UPI00399D62FE
MGYRYEELGAERFQQFCQALLLEDYPNLQCMPVGQPDGGRDGVVRVGGTDSDEFVVLQVKFVRNPEARDARSSIVELLRTESKKIDHLINEGMTKYIFVTNVSGSSHPAVGSIDRVNDHLDSNIDCDSICIWRDDLDRRLDGNVAIRWAYSELIKTGDVLRVLLSGMSGREDSAYRVLKLFMATQFEFDAKLKFRQADLEKGLFDLFVDVPIAADEAQLREQDYFKDQLDNLSQISRIEANKYSSSGVNLGGALALLSDELFAREFTTVVVEGAPGQGKSTTAQCLCQVHRAKFLEVNDRGNLLERAPKHSRIPIKIDLRDYSVWLSGNHPFTVDQERLPSFNPALEAFIAFQISFVTGMEFSPNDLLDVSEKISLLLVLDGFDEVADIHLRNTIVDEVNKSAARLAKVVLSLQVVVTSRPTAFANSAGFPKDRWLYLSLCSLEQDTIFEYTDKWLEAKSADVREAREVKGVLSQKLNQPHVSELSKNPMQLAILLNLIMSQGASLPDKRTALYDNYIEMFLNREAEKSNVVRDCRDLLVHIHQYLAFVLQVEAENSGAGHISQEQFKDRISAYLREKGHDSSLLDQLFSGVVERVVALVSRVQGTLEFEVQPLREYFAARYLYDTARYSPAGTACTGTLPDRFKAILVNRYWSNVARFYAGCYSTGELASLVNDMREVAERADLQHVGYVPSFAYTLLSDYVFGQMPLVSCDLLSWLCNRNRIHMCWSSDRRSVDVSYLSSTGKPKETLLSYCRGNISENNVDLDIGFATRLAQMLTAINENSITFDLCEIVRPKFRNDECWVEFCGRYCSLSSIDMSRIEAAKNSLSGRARRVFVTLVCQANQSNQAITKELMQAIESRYVIDFDVMIYGPTLYRQSSYVYWLSVATLFCILQGRWFEEAFEDVSFEVNRFMGLSNDEKISGKSVIGERPEVSEALEAFFDRPKADIKSDRGAWFKILQVLEREFPDTLFLYKMTQMAVDAGVVCEESECDLKVWSEISNLWRHKDNVDWLGDFLVNLQNPINHALVIPSLRLIIDWCSFSTVIRLIETLDKVFCLLDVDSWNELFDYLDRVGIDHKPIKRADLVESGLLKSGVISRISIRGRMYLHASTFEEEMVSGIHELVDSQASAESLNSYLFSLIAVGDGSSIDWEEVIDAASQYPASERVRGLPMLGYELSATLRQMPIEQARKVCVEPWAYPDFFVGFAEEVILAFIGQKSEQIGVIARRDTWFDNNELLA